MPTDPRKRQKKLERKNAKRKDKHEVIVREKVKGLGERLADAAKHPILHSGIGVTLEESGIAQVFISRQLPNGSVAFASFLVDRCCLGVKDCFGNIPSRFEYDSRYLGKMNYRPAAPETVRKLVEEAVAYADKLGFHPHPDYLKVRQLFGDIDPTASQEQFEFGRDGKPFYTNGPYETPARIRAVINTLVSTCGVGGFDYIIGGKAAFMDDVLPGAVKESEFQQLQEKLVERRRMLEEEAETDGGEKQSNA